MIEHQTLTNAKERYPMGERTPSLRDGVLQHFEPHMAALLLEFGRYVSSLQCDYIIFMARKSLRLYDMLLRIGEPRAISPILSDRVLDQRPSALDQKKIAIIDDSLIVGTTLDRAQVHLRVAHNADVTLHVFCASRRYSDYWETVFGKEDKIFATLEHDRLQMFCAAEVLALASVPIPYLVDYPISQPLALRRTQIERMAANFHWVPYKISSDLQESKGALIYTFLPTGDLMAKFERLFGEDVFALLDLIKVRLFCRKNGTRVRGTLVPIVTFRAITVEQTDFLLERILRFVASRGDFDMDRIAVARLNEVGRLRLVQYLYSICVIKTFWSDYSALGGATTTLHLSLEEAQRHYGFWLRREFATLHSLLGPDSWPCIKPPAERPRALRPQKLPDPVRRSTSTKFVTLPPLRTGDALFRPTSSRNVLTDIAQMFLGLYRQYELPARGEALQFGRKINHISPEEAPHRDRLNDGLAWSSIVGRITSEYRITGNRRTAQLLSLILDHLVDMGIAVPINCIKGGTVFRAYRHGEDVIWLDQEVKLAQSAAEGFLEASGREAIPRLVFEKMLVILIRVGAANKFLQPTFGPTGAEGIARIGFHLHGAVPIIPSQPDGYFADRQSSWLTASMLERGAFQVHPTTRGYMLGDPVEASTLRPSSLPNAKQVGHLLGLLIRPPNAKRERHAPLSSRMLTILATCITPRDTTIALAAELNFFLDWFERRGLRLFLDLIADRTERKRSAREFVDDSHGFQALASARMKYFAYLRGAAADIAGECRSYLESLPNGDFLALAWDGFWMPVQSDVTEHEAKTFSGPISQLAGALLEASYEMYVIALASYNLIEVPGTPTEAIPERISHLQRALKADVAQTRRLARRSVTVEKALSSAQSTAAKHLSTDTAREVIREVCCRIDRNAVRYRAIVDHCRRLFAEFTRTSKIEEFQYVVWYDIIDSTGEKSGLQGYSLSVYRDTVEKCREALNQHFKLIIQKAARGNTRIHPSDGMADSKNDEKYLFVGGPNGRQWLQSIVEVILRTACSFDRTRVRMLVIPCDFAGTTAVRDKGAQTVEGGVFWEHLSRLQKMLKSDEARFEKGYSILYVCTEKLQDLALHEDLKWVPKFRKYIETSPTGHVIRTLVIGGSVSFDVPSTGEQGVLL